MAELSAPLVNGVRHSFVSLKIKFLIYGGETKTLDFYLKSINYSASRERSEVRGNHVDPIALTRGENSYSCDWEMFRAEFDALRTEMGPGYGDKAFTIQVVYGEDGFDTVMDEIVGCHLDAKEFSNSQGPDATVVKFSCKPLKILVGAIDDCEFPLAPAGLELL